MYRFYRTLTKLISPAVPLLLKHRLNEGKEDADRLPERSGIASMERPKGLVVWIHAASVGESNSVMPLIDAILWEFSGVHVLVTTVTVTSAQILGERLPKRALHQYVPVDAPDAVDAFLNHWKPDIALWVDSELWPNIIMQTRQRGIPMGIINARMSEKSFRLWKFAGGFIKDILGSFKLCFPQSEEDAERLRTLGVPKITSICNLKYDALPLPFSEVKLEKLTEILGGRHVWLAASTHTGEEAIIASIHKSLKKEFPDLLTIIVPRHARRGNIIATELGDLNIVKRSKFGMIKPDTDIYIADTMGELGLFYRLSKIALIGGSLVAHGGQNPLEAARIGCAIITGPHFSNFNTVIHDMQKENAIIIVDGKEDLRAKLKELFGNAEMQERLANAALAHAKSKGGAINTIMNELRPYLT